MHKRLEWLLRSRKDNDPTDRNYDWALNNS